MKLKTKKSFVFLSVLAIVIVSGCIGGTSTSNVQFSQTAGAVINDFSFDTAALFEGEEAQLTVQVQNVGAKNMTGNSQLWIYGPVIGTTDQSWKLKSGAVSKTLETTGFFPPDVARRIPGSVDIQTLDLQAPTLGLAPGMKNPYTFYARLCYPYSTTGFSNINEVSKNELRISNPPTSDAITRATAGPIQIKLLSGDTVRSDRTMTLVFEITNVGGGFSTLPGTACTAMKPDISAKDTDKVKLTVKVDGTNTADCVDKEVNIRRGNNVACKYTPAASTTTNPTTTHVVVATATYNYFITKQADMTVESDQ